MYETEHTLPSKSSINIKDNLIYQNCNGISILHFTFALNAEIKNLSTVEDCGRLGLVTISTLKSIIKDTTYNLQLAYLGNFFPI